MLDVYVIGTFSRILDMKGKFCVTKSEISRFCLKNAMQPRHQAIMFAMNKMHPGLTFKRKCGISCSHEMLIS